MSEAPPRRDDIPVVFQRSHASASRLIHLVPDELAEAVPDHPLFSFPRTAKPQDDGFRDVSSRCFANAINRTAWYIRDLLGPPKNFEAVAYIGSNDIRYFLFMFAAIKVGYKGVDCQIFLRARDTNVDHILNERAMRVDVVPELEALLDATSVETYPYTKSFQEAHMDPCLVLHTTGSTGLPKPITWKVGILSTYEAWRTIPAVDGHVPTTEIYQQSKRAYTSMPLFHTSGLNAGITWALLLGVTLVYGGAQVVPNATYTDKMHKYANVDASMGAPSLYEELSRDPDSLARIKKMHYVVASGAPLSQTAGALISRYTRVISNLGATETACLQRLAPSIDDWAYFYWHPTHSGIQMRETVNGLYELFLVKDPKLSLYQGIFNTFPDIQEWSMNDLYARHPDPAKSFLYTYQGRKDDILVLSNGEKIAPALMEATLMSDPLVKGAMVVGKGQFQPAVLVDLVEEPPKGAMQRHRKVEQLMPVIHEANAHAPAHGKLDQYHVLFTDPEKPISYLGQGKIQRSQTYALYAKDIEKIFRFADDASEQFGFSRLPQLDFLHEESIAQWLRELLIEITDLKDFKMDQDLFSAGIDSLQVMRMSRELRFQARKAGLGNCSTDNFLPRAFYQHPTLNRMKAFIFEQASARPMEKRTFDGVLKPQDKNLNGLDADHHTAKTTSESSSMRALFQQYASSLGYESRPSVSVSTKRMTVVLTGSTGSLGSYLLETLSLNKNVLHIICLNRSATAAERQHQTGSKRGLSPIDPQRVEFLQADLSKPQLGLDITLYERLRTTVTHVIHNQWPVNFNWALSSFEPYIRGVRNLVEFSINSAQGCFLLFVSSVSSVGAWSGPGTVPEEVNHDFNVAGELGYGQSKLISECLLDQAAKQCGVRSACCRVGIIAGPVDKQLGLWSKHEYIPSIVVSSVTLGVFPVTFPARERIDWLPVDRVSHVLVEILVSSTKSTPKGDASGTLMYHVVNPNAASWSTLAPDILRLYPQRHEMKAVQYDDWVQALANSGDEFVDAEIHPAVKLLDFYRRAAKASKSGPRVLPSHKAEAASRTLRGVGPVRQDWVKVWMQQWGIAETGD
ncbi:hypothetical protein XANCAGTX0491_004809 [Xanthoria calcicola]